MTSVARNDDESEPEGRTERALNYSCGALLAKRSCEPRSEDSSDSVESERGASRARGPTLAFGRILLAKRLDSSAEGQERPLLCQIGSQSTGQELKTKSEAAEAKRKRRLHSDEG